MVIHHGYNDKLEARNDVEVPSHEDDYSHSTRHGRYRRVGRYCRHKREGMLGTSWHGRAGRE